MSTDIPFFISGAFMNRCELLSPAGDYKCFIAAVNAGADAVYLGLDKYSARANANNFTEEELINALDIAHILGRKVYLTVNTLFKDDETDKLYDLLYQPYVNGLDGVIVQDIGVMIQISRLFPDLPIHVSTQAGICSAEAVRFLKPLGIKRVVLARELSLKEIRSIINDTGIETECFIHGSLCYCYSGKCLMSSFIGGRSGNRGRCAQPCRLPYDGSYPLSLKDLCTIDHIPELIDAGICSFKIEGRMKSSDYVYGVTSIYRQYINEYYENKDFDVDPADRDRLIAYYTRGNNCNGYYFKHNGADMITADSPSYSTSATKEAGDDHAHLPSVPVSMSCHIVKDEPVNVDVSDDTHSISVCTAIVPDTAKNRPLTVDEAKASLSRSGNTLFTVKDPDVTVDEGVFIPKGNLNEIRRCALDAFKLKLLEGFKRDEPKRCAPVDPVIPDIIKACPPDVRISVLTSDQFAASVDTDADAVIIPMGLYPCICTKGKIDLNGKRLYISLPVVVREDDRTQSIRRVIDFIISHDQDTYISGYYVSDPGAALLVAKHSHGKETVYDIHMYAYNRLSYEYYMNNGCSKTTVPVELNYRELIGRSIPNEELIVYGHLPMMISANCIMATRGECYATKSGHYTYITDRRGAKLFVYCNCSDCTNIIYNSVRLCITDESKLFDRIAPSSIRFIFTDEDKNEVADIMKRYYVSRRSNGSTDTRLIKDHTKGHLNRGVD